MNTPLRHEELREPLVLVPMTLKAAAQFVAQEHRHHRAPHGALWAVGIKRGETLCGVAVVGRPVARALDEGQTAEITRLATDGTPNACSMLYGAARRAAKALGYRKLITYTLESEPGSSLRAAGFVEVARTRGGSWDREDRRRTDKAPTCPKIRWEVSL